MFNWTSLDQGLVATGENGQQYWLQSSTAIRVPREPGIALFLKPTGGSRFVYHSTHKSIGGAMRAAETLQNQIKRA